MPGQAVLEGFEKFTQKGRSFRPKISIRARGQMGFNNGAVVHYKLNDYDYVILYYSKDKNQIAIRLTNNKDDEGSIKLVKKSGNYFFSGRSFLDFYRLASDKTKIFDLERVEDTLLLFSLGKDTGKGKDE